MIHLPGPLVGLLAVVLLGVVVAGIVVAVLPERDRGGGNDAGDEADDDAGDEGDGGVEVPRS